MKRKKKLDNSDTWYNFNRIIILSEALQPNSKTEDSKELNEISIKILDMLEEYYNEQK